MLNLAANGALECGYIPDSRDERGTLTLIRIEGSFPRLLMAANEAPELDRKCPKMGGQRRKRAGTVGSRFPIQQAQEPYLDL